MGALLSLKVEWNYVITWKTDATGDCHTKWNKPDSWRQISHFLTHGWINPEWKWRHDRYKVRLQRRVLLLGRVHSGIWRGPNWTGSWETGWGWGVAKSVWGQKSKMSKVYVGGWGREDWGNECSQSSTWSPGFFLACRSLPLSNTIKGALSHNLMLNLISSQRPSSSCCHTEAWAHSQGDANIPWVPVPTSPSWSLCCGYYAYISFVICPKLYTPLLLFLFKCSIRFRRGLDYENKYCIFVQVATTFVVFQTFL